MTRVGRKIDDTADNPVSESDLPSPPISPGQPQELAGRPTRARDSALVSELKKKLAEHLPAGHPSSPFNEDGSRRPADTSVKDTERLIPPLTDAQWIEHRQEVTNRLEKALAAGLMTDLLHTVNPDHDIWSDERTERHDEILADIYAAAAHVPCEGKALLAGGLGGAGKTTVLDAHATIDRSQYLTINPDQFKEELARRGLLPEISGLSPMERTTLAHKESSYLAKRLAQRAMADGKNVIWDVTMSSVESTAGRIDDLRSAGYKEINGIFVGIPTEVSMARADARHRRGHDLYLAGQGLGGRIVPPEVTRSQADREYGSINRRAFELVKPMLVRWAAYDNSVDGRDPILIEQID